MRSSRAIGIGTIARPLPSRLRALILIATVLDLRLVGRLVRRLTREPRSEAIEVDGVQVDIVRPGGEEPWPCWVFINWAHPERRREPVVTRLSNGLARAGFIVFIPDLPGLGEGTITARTLESSCAVTRWATEHEDVTENRVALIGASTGAALALLTAALVNSLRTASRSWRPSRLSPTSSGSSASRRPGPTARGTPSCSTRWSPLHRCVVAWSLAATIENQEERELLLETLARSEDDEGADPIALLPRNLKTSEGRAVLAVLTNEEPEHFAEAYGRLDARAIELSSGLSPLSVSKNVRAPVEVVVPPSDMYFPLGEAQALAAALPRAELTVTATLDHTLLQFSAAQLRSRAHFDRFVVRGLRTAAG